VRLHAAAEEANARAVSIMSLLTDDACAFRVEPTLAAARVDAFQSDLEDVLAGGREDGWYSDWQQVEGDLSQRLVVGLSSLGLAAGEEGVPVVRASGGQLPVASAAEAEESVRRMAKDGYRVVVAFEQKAEAERAVFAAPRLGGAVVTDGEISLDAGVTFLTVPLRGHFIMPELKLAVLGDSMLFPRRHKAAVAGPTVAVELSSFRDLRKGDYVVHEDHGIGRFEGISTKTVAGVTRDYLDLAYRDDDMLYVPHDQISKVMRYVGAGGNAPGLSKLGGSAWENLKSRVRKAARQVAGELLHLYALRQSSKGYAYSEDGEWQARFEKAFPFDETEDQLRAIDVIKDDMESPRPMDRLLCGDVGYGKTEVALRAAFKATLDGKQVMVLVPTTILAQQHYGTFRERFADFPVASWPTSRRVAWTCSSAPTACSHKTLSPRIWDWL
jgi:transcription-repair coupling factor (superfamily II helicase)